MVAVETAEAALAAAATAVEALVWAQPEVTRGVLAGRPAWWLASGAAARVGVR